MARNSKSVLNQCNDIFILSNGNISKVPRFNLQLCKKEIENDNNKEEKKEKKGTI